MTDADDYRQAQPLADAVGAVLRPLRPIIDREPAVTYRLTEADLDTGIPPEYRDARLADKVRAMLTGSEVSVTLIGPPGTGKTYQAWAALRANRRKRCGGLIGNTCSWIIRGDAPPRSEWVRRMVCPAQDAVRIISESGDIQRHRFDRGWLDEQAAFPGWLVVDDIGYAEGGDWPLEAVYHLANERRAWARPTMWTTNLTPSQIKEVYSAAIASRLLGGLVIELDGSDRRLA